VASTDTHIDPLAIAGLRRALGDPGAQPPLSIAAGLSALGTPSDQARDLIMPLLTHPSALVRDTAARPVSG
jgi:hypothetical protein